MRKDGSVRTGPWTALAAAIVLAGVGAAWALEDREDDAKSEQAIAAMKAARELGARLWKDKALGTNDRSCSTCHDNPKRPDMSLKGVAAQFPKWDRNAGRVITLQEKFVQMQEKSLKVKTPMPLGDPRWTALEVYLKSL